MLRIGTSAICTDGTSAICTDIDRVHRIRMEYTKRNSGKKIKSIIVKFKPWRTRKQFQNAIPKSFKDVKKNQVVNHLLSRLIEQKGVTYYYVKLRN